MLKRRAKRKISCSHGYSTSLDDKLAEIAPEGFGYIIPPDILHVAIYFLQKNLGIANAEVFFRHYESRNWKTITGKTLKNWKVLAKEWIYNLQQEDKLKQRLAVKRNAFPGT